MSNLLHQTDSEYQSIYKRALEATQMEHNQSRYDRFYHLLQFFKQTFHLHGDVAECGAWRGMSSYMMLETRRRSPEAPKLVRHFIIDSFEGLSIPSPEDISSVYDSSEIKGRFACSLEQVDKNLAQFDWIRFVKGWIPKVFEPDSLVNNSLDLFGYSFVHIDVELYEPTLASLNFFYPKMNKGGIIVCDDCGYDAFPGSHKAMNKFCEENKLSPIYLTTGNGVLIKR